MNDIRLTSNWHKVVLIFISFLSIPVSSKDASAPDVTYEELQTLNADCNKLDNCNISRQEDRLDFYNCNCGSFCSQFDTCCVDSPHRSTRRVKATDNSVCSNVYGDPRLQVFMINVCKDSWRADSLIVKLCLEDGESSNDPLTLVPVTTSSSVTYKNYFCMKCNEEMNQNFTFWNIHFKSDDNLDLKFSISDIKYDHSKKMWTVEDKKNAKKMDIVLSMEIPDNMRSRVSLCRTDVISNCSPSWEDEVVRQKCSAYMGIVLFRKNEKNVQYRNAHCAICNYEDLKQMICSDFIFLRTMPFSYSLLLDVNESNGDRVGRVRRCDESSVYDPFFEKCRILTCALPDHSVVDGKCVKS